MVVAVARSVGIEACHMMEECITVLGLLSCMCGRDLVSVKANMGMFEGSVVLTVYMGESLGPYIQRTGRG